MEFLSNNEILYLERFSLILLSISRLNVMVHGTEFTIKRSGYMYLILHTYSRQNRVFWNEESQVQQTKHPPSTTGSRVSSSR